MNKYKKIISWFLISSLIFWNISFSFANEKDSLLTTQDKDSVNKEILTLQTNILKKSEKYIETFFTNFDKVANYEETWNVKSSLKIDSDIFWKINWNLDISNYKYKKSLLDSQLDLNLNLTGQMVPLSGSWEKFDFKTFTSFLYKDNKIYLLLKDLGFNVSSDYISNKLNKIKEIFNDNKYIVVDWDNEDKKIIDRIKNINKEYILNNFENILSKTLFVPYKKEWNKYFLIPTKEFCDFYASFNNLIFEQSDFYTPKSCDNIYYTRLAYIFKNKLDLYLEIWENENILWLYSKDINNKISLKIYFNNNTINKIILISGNESGEFNLTYFKNTMFNFYFVNEKNKSKFLFKSKLDNNDNFTYIKWSFDFNKLIVWDINLLNKNLSIVWKIKQKWYDYESSDFKYKLKNIYWFKFTWQANELNTFDNFILKVVWIDVKNKEAFLNWSLSLNNKKLNWLLKLNIFDKDLNIKLSWNKLDNYLSTDIDYNYDIYNWNLNLIIDETNNKDYYKLDYTLNDWEKEIIKFNTVTDGIKKYNSDIKIDAPINVKTIDLNSFKDEEKNDDTDYEQESYEENYN